LKSVFPITLREGCAERSTLTVSQAPVSKYTLRPRRPQSQAWRTLLKNHEKDLIALDFFTVPTAIFRVLFVLVTLTHRRRRLSRRFAGS